MGFESGTFLGTQVVISEPRKDGEAAEIHRP